VVEGPVLLHQDDDVLDVLEVPVRRLAGMAAARVMLLDRA